MQEETKHIFNTRVEDYTSKDYDVVSMLVKELPAVQSEKILGNENFIKRVTNSDSIIGKMMTALQNLKMKKNLSNADYQTYNQIYNTYIKALESVGKTWKNGKVINIKKDDEPEFSIQKDENGFYVKIDTDQNIFDGLSNKECQKVAEEYIIKHFEGRVFPLGQDDQSIIPRKMSGEYIHPGKHLSNTDYFIKMRIATELDNLLKTSKFDNIKNNEKKKTNYDYYAYYQTTFEIDGKSFICTINVGIVNNQIELYDITNIKNNNPNYRSESVSKAVVLDDFSSISIIDNKIKNVNSADAKTSNSKDDISFSTKAENYLSDKIDKEYRKNEARYKEEYLDNLRDNGFSEEEIEDAKENWSYEEENYIKEDLIRPNIQETFYLDYNKALDRIDSDIRSFVGTLSKNISYKMKETRSWAPGDYHSQYLSFNLINDNANLDEEFDIRLSDGHDNGSGDTLHTFVDLIEDYDSELSDIKDEIKEWYSTFEEDDINDVSFSISKRDSFNNVKSDIKNKLDNKSSLDFSKYFASSTQGKVFTKSEIVPLLSKLLKTNLLDENGNVIANVKGVDQDKLSLLKRMV